MARCHGLNKEGNPCRFDLPEGLEYCAAHNPNVPQVERRLAASRAGKASGVARRQKSVYEVPLNLANRAGIQAAIQAVAALEFAGRLPAARTRNLLRALALAARNFEPPRTKRDEDAPPAQHGELFWSWLNALDGLLPDVLVESEVQDTRRLVDQHHLRRYGRLMPSKDFADILAQLPGYGVQSPPAAPPPGRPIFPSPGTGDRDKA